MKRKTLKRWVEACLVGSAVAGGCNRQEVPVANNNQPLLPPISAWAQKDPKTVAASVKKPDSGIVPTAYTPDKPGTSIAMATSSALPPIVYADPPSAPTAPAPVATPPKPLSATTMAAAVPVKLEKDLAKGVDRYGHAPDYSWLCGEVQHTHKGWRLRYASLDETDTYGGSVTLSDDAKLSQLKDGDVFVVEGHLQDPDSHSSAPVYVLTDLKSHGH